MPRSASVAIIQQMEKSDKQTNVIHPENGVNPLQTLKSRNLWLLHLTIPKLRSNHRLKLTAHIEKFLSARSLA